MFKVIWAVLAVVIVQEHNYEISVRRFAPAIVWDRYAKLISGN